MFVKGLSLLRELVQRNRNFSKIILKVNFSRKLRLQNLYKNYNKKPWICVPVERVLVKNVTFLKNRRPRKRLSQSVTKGIIHVAKEMV